MYLGTPHVLVTLSVAHVTFARTAIQVAVRISNQYESNRWDRGESNRDSENICKKGSLSDSLALTSERERSEIYGENGEIELERDVGI